jgi:DNA segregation ATPase FtsK/SpoIIIE-like protein
LGPYSIPTGVTPAGEIEWINLPELPHMLVAGSTGSGKSMFLYSLIASLAHYCAPDDLDMVLVDPKRTDFILFSRLPHLRNGEIIEDAEDAVRELTSLINSEVERRTDTLQENLHKNIYSYNESNPEDRISPIFVFIDEFAELSDVLKGGDQEEEFHDALQRLAQRARNVGIHLIVATQRPTADVISGNVKANLPCRVSFQLGSGTDSRTILDTSGAENLLGNGDMLLRKKGNEVKRLQGLYLPEEEIRERFT